MPPAPKAISQGSNGAGAGAGGALRGISAANDEPAVIASTAAAKTSFFMTIPTTLKTAQFRPPKGKRQPTATKFLNAKAIWYARFMTGSKKDSHLPTF